MSEQPKVEARKFWEVLNAQDEPDLVEKSSQLAGPSEDLQEEVFRGNTTLWSVLNSQGVPGLAEQTRQLKEQLDTLAITLQNYQFETNADIVRLNTNVTTLNTQMSSVLTSISDLTISNTAIENQIRTITGELSSISADIVTLSADVSKLKIDVAGQNLIIGSLSNSINGLDTRVKILEAKDVGTIVRYDVRYSVIEWPFWQTGWDNYEMLITGPGGYVPINRSVTRVVNGISRSVVFGIAFRDIPPNTNGAPAPLMEGLASVNTGQGASLIYINRVQ